MSTELITKAVQRALADFEFFARNCVRIRDKKGRSVPFELNSTQRKLFYRIEARRLAGKPILVVILKARQMGVSTFIEAYILWRLLRESNKRGLVVAHLRDAARNILGITRYAIRNLPAWFTQTCGITPEYFTKFEVQFAHNGSGLRISSAESPEAGRGETLHFLHLSEAAFYPDADRLINSLLEAVPKTEGTAIFVESTGKEPAGYFYNLWTQATKGLVEYEALFFPWYEHEEYRMPVPEGYEPHVPEDLADLVAEGKITPEALMWREWVIQNDFLGNEAAFAQEYPTRPEDAFYKPDARLFPPEAIRARLKALDEANIHPQEGFLVDPGPRFVPTAGERLHVYKPPQSGRVYVIGADVGSGVVVNREGDYSCADVIDVATGEQVAHLHMNAEPGVFALELFLLGRWYNNALIAVEVTGGHGLSVVNNLRDMGYTALYRRQVYDRTTQQWVDKLGWNTTKATKKLIIDGLRADFRNGQIIINERATLNEMLTFIKVEGSDKMEAATGAKDDRVISLAIAAQARREAAPAFVTNTGQPVTVEMPQQPTDLSTPSFWRKPRGDGGIQHPELGAFF